MISKNHNKHTQHKNSPKHTSNYLKVIKIIIEVILTYFSKNNTNLRNPNTTSIKIDEASKPPLPNTLIFD